MPWNETVPRATFTRHNVLPVEATALSASTGRKLCLMKVARGIVPFHWVNSNLLDASSSAWMHAARAPRTSIWSGLGHRAFLACPACRPEQEPAGMQVVP